MTPEAVGEVWAMTVNPSPAKVAEIIGRTKFNISAGTVQRMKNNGWAEPARRVPRGRPRITETKKTAMNKAVLAAAKFYGVRKDAVLDTLNLTQELRGYLSGKDISFNEVSEEMNKTFGLAITKWIVQLVESDMMTKAPKDFVLVLTAIAASVSAVNDPKVKQSVQDGMKVIEGGEIMKNNDSQDLKAFLATVK